MYSLKQASRSWHEHLVTHLKSLGFEQSLADPYGFRLIEAGSVSVNAEAHVDDKGAAGRKEGRDWFSEELDHLVPIIDLGELRWHAGCRYSRGKVVRRRRPRASVYGEDGQAIWRTSR